MIISDEKSRMSAPGRSIERTACGFAADIFTIFPQPKRTACGFAADIFIIVLEKSLQLERTACGFAAKTPRETAASPQYVTLPRLRLMIG